MGGQPVGSPVIPETYDRFSWQTWDWRPLARLVVWIFLAAAWAYWRHVLSLAPLKRILRELALGWLLSFGLLTYVQVLIAAGALRLALAFDAAAYALLEGLLRPFLGRTTFTMSFLATFGVELAVVLGSPLVCRTLHIGSRFAVLLTEALR